MGRVREYEKQLMSDHAYVSIYLRLSKEEITIERQTMGLLDVAG